MLRAAFVAIGAVLGQMLASTAFAVTHPTAVAPEDPGGLASNRTADERKASLRRAARLTERQREFYAARWGVDKLKVSYTSSGNLIRFSYRVTEPGLAKPLADRGQTPYLLGTRTRAVLQVPVMEKVGPLRQAMTQEAGKEYWMTFSNKGNLVRPGDRVNVTIGSFHADGLLVE